MADNPRLEQREQRELLALMWFFWAGILMATVGELTLIFMSTEGAHASAGGVSYPTIFILVVVGFLWSLVALIHRYQFGGGGMPTAIFCWMLAKGSAVLGIVTFFLEPNWMYTGGIMAGFLVIMGLLQPPNYMRHEG